MMQRKFIPQFTSINRTTHSRALQDNLCSNGRNIIFKDGKVRSRFGYSQLGNQLSGTVLALNEFTKLRTNDSALIGITENSTYQYNEDTEIWEEFAASHNTNTVNQPDIEVEFNAATTTYISSCKLTSTKFAVCFRDEGDSNKGKCIIGTLAAGAISYGTEYEFNAGATTYTSVCLLGVDDETTPTEAYIVVAYTDAGNSTYGTCRFGKVTLSTGVIDFATYSEYAINAYATNQPSIQMLDFSVSGDLARFCVAYIANNLGSAIVGSVPITTGVITYGSVYNFEATPTTRISLCTLDSTHIVVSFWAANYVKAKMGLIILATKVINFSSYSTKDIEYYTVNYPLQIKKLSSTTFLIGYIANSTYRHGRVVVGLVNTSTGEITTGTVVDSISAAVTMAIDVLDSTHFVIADASNSGEGMLSIGSISGTTISIGTNYTYKSTVPIYIGLTGLSFSGFIVFFSDQFDSWHGTSMYYNRLGFTGTGSGWNTAWPDAVYNIKFGTDDVEGTGTPDVWYKINTPESATYLTLSDDTLLDYLGNDLKLLSADTDYVIRISFLSDSDNYFDVCNIIEGLGGGDEKQVIFTNAVDPIKLFDGSALSTLDLTGDGGAAPLSLAKLCIYYHGHLMFAYVYDDPNWMPQSVYWCYRGQPTYWSTGSAGYADLIEGDDKITRMLVLKQRLYILKEDSIVECYYTGYVDPAFEFIEDRVKGIGCPYGRTAINNGAMIIFRGRDNIYIFDGVSTPQPIGDAIFTDLKNNEDPDYAHKSFSSHLRNEFLYCLHTVQTGHTNPNLIYVWNYLRNSWTIWEFANDMTAWAVRGNNVVFGDEDGYVYTLDYTDTDDNGTDIDAYVETKDFSFPDKNGTEFNIRLLETIMHLEDNDNDIQISCSVNYGDTWSNPIIIDQDTDNSVYEHIQNWLQRGKTMKFKIENIEGSQFALENLELGYEQAGIITR